MNSSLNSINSPSLKQVSASQVNANTSNILPHVISHSSARPLKANYDNPTFYASGNQFRKARNNAKAKQGNKDTQILPVISTNLDNISLSQTANNLLHTEQKKKNGGKNSQSITFVTFQSNFKLTEK